MNRCQVINWVHRGSNYFDPNILVAKPTDHMMLFERINELDGLGQSGHLRLADDKGRCHIYRWDNQVPLKGTKDYEHLLRNVADPPEIRAQ